LKDFKLSVVRALLPHIILERLNVEPAHGYKLIRLIRKRCGVYFGPSTVYPLLNRLEDEGYVTSEWVLNGERPQKVYKITAKGKAFLGQTTAELTLLVKPQIEVKVH
jgi:PadR family transcriptional regulator PadR